MGISRGNNMSLEDNRSDYDFSAIESKWQQYWEKNQTFKTTEIKGKPKYYILDMFPYPSGDGLHVGHIEGYTATDIVARYKRMKGFNVLHPMGWDAFGLPAEQFAIKTGQHPKVTTQKNIARFKKQIQRVGLSYDWSREIDTTDPEYYRWTQWIFLKLFERGLAYQSFEPVNWCPELGTVLANEEVIDGKSEVGGFPVFKKPLRQWVLKITAYAERLLEDLELLDWPESLKEMQRHWIGKSQGARVTFKIKAHSGLIKTQAEPLSFNVFTTRPDTLFGATFCVLAPEHPLVAQITTAEQKSLVDAYVLEASQRSDRERTSQDIVADGKNNDKTGVFTGAMAINPANGKEIPIWIADYVLMSYGSGAIMAVPGHDERDHAFATKHHLPILRVISGGEEEDIQKKAHAGDGILIHSDFLNGLPKDQAISRMVQWLEEKGLGQATVSYKLRDWLFSRQRYWGEPFPIALDHQGEAVAINDADLPVLLPDMEDFKPTRDAEPPLARAVQWTQVSIDGKPHKRETNVMPQWAGSCWYYLRFLDPLNKNEFCALDKEKYWMPVDLYVGGAEHAVLHLLYARFWHKVLYDAGLVTTKEPFLKLVHPGTVLGENNEKMSKSRGNVVNPDDIVKEYGADTLRLFEMFMGPLTATKPWQTAGISGVHRFLRRVIRIGAKDGESTAPQISPAAETEEIKRALHKTIRKVSEDMEGLGFNTAIAAMMEFVNVCYKYPSISLETYRTLLLLLAPFAPHLAEELWERSGQTHSLAYEPWPKYIEALTIDLNMTLAIQVNGKLRGDLLCPKDYSKEEIFSKAKNLDSVKRHMDGKVLVKEIYVPGKIVNFVVKD
jgi:leucyl-tRNA synthetase